MAVTIHSRCGVWVVREIKPTERAPRRRPQQTTNQPKPQYHIHPHTDPPP